MTEGALKQTVKNCCTNSTKLFFPLLFLLFNLITCQWIRPKREGEKCCCDYDNKCCDQEEFNGNTNCKCNKCDSVWIRCCRSKKYCYFGCACCKKGYRFGCCQINCGCFIMIISIAAVAINVFPLAMFIAGWATCKNGTEYEISELCYTLYFNITKMKLPPLVLRNAEDDVNNSDTKVAVQDFIDVSKISLLFSTTATAVSHVLFIWALWCLYCKHYKSVNDCLLRIENFCKRLKCNDKDKKDKLPLDPFNDKTDESDLMGINTEEELEELYKEKIKRNCDDFFCAKDVRTNTPLQGERLYHYVTRFIIGFMLLAATAGVFFWLYCQQNKDRMANYTFNLEIAALILYAYSLFRVLVSCFIFSKLMYGIQRRCEEIELFVYHINEIYKAQTSTVTRSQSLPCVDTSTQFLPLTIDPIDPKQVKLTRLVEKYLKEHPKFEDEEMRDFVNSEYSIHKCRKYLKKHDKHFVNTAVSTLSWLQLWFLLHWVLHIISTFMIMSLLIDAIALHIKSRISHIEQGVGFHPGEIVFLFMFSVVHWFFLLHPCLRAASVTRTRQRVIRRISEKASKEYNAIPKEVMQEFIESMKRRKFSFRLRILCARIPFNLNIAYLSIAFGFVSVIVTLITVVTK